MQAKSTIATAQGKHGARCSQSAMRDRRLHSPIAKEQHKSTAAAGTNYLMPAVWAMSKQQEQRRQLNPSSKPMASPKVFLLNTSSQSLRCA